MFTKQVWRLAIGVLASLWIAPAIGVAAQNTWTGSRPRDAQTDFANLVAADPDNPYVVYAVFEPDLFKSADGGRTWTKLASFTYIYSLLLHPADSSILYVGATRDPGLAGVFKSTDSGQTWTRTALSPSLHLFVLALAGDSTNASTVYAGSGDGWVDRTTDGGATWTRGQGLTGAVSALVIHPRQPQVVYTGTEGSYYYSDTLGAVAKSANAGSTWSYLASPMEFETVSALAIDSSTPSKLYMGVASPHSYLGQGLFRSDDDGSHWSRIGAGLPEYNYASSLAATNLGWVYAGMTTPFEQRAGVFRSFDSGQTWTGLGAARLGRMVNSIQALDSQAFLFASTDSGFYSFEIGDGPIDVAAASGETRLLSWSANRLTLLTLDAAGNWSSAAPGDPSMTWSAVAIAAGADGLSRVLWQCADGRWGIEIIGPAGRQAVFAFAPQGSLFPVDVAVAEDGSVTVLFVGSLGEASVARVDSSGAVRGDRLYGPTRGWTAVAIADGPGGTRVLWRCTDGRGGISLHDAEGVMTTSLTWPARAGFAVEDIALGADGFLRLLRISPGGEAEVSTIDGAGQPGSAQTFESTGLPPRRISAGADGKTRLLLGGSRYDGSSLWILNPDNTVASRHDH